MTGRMTISSGGTSVPASGVVKVWPWIGGDDMVGALTDPVFVANRFGMAEAPENTYFAASALWTSPTLAALGTRVIGGTDLRTLSDGTMVCSFSASAVPSGGSLTAVSSLAPSAWNNVTVPSPLAGGVAQPAAFWDSTAYPTKSVAKLWSNSRVFMAAVKTASAATGLAQWVTSNAASGAVIAVSESYSECKTMAASGTRSMLKTAGGWPGDGTYPTMAQIATGGLYGVLLPVEAVTIARINEIKGYGLKAWAYTVNGAAVADGFLSQGLQGIVTDQPTTTSFPKPPANRVGTVYGMTSASDWRRYFGPTAVGGPQPGPGVERYYSSSASVPTGWSNSTTNNVWISWKPALSSVTLTMARSNITTIKNAIGSNKQRHVFICVWHEPENLGKAAIPSWQQAHSYLHQAAIEARAEGYRIWVAPIICDWTFCRCSCWRWNSGRGIEWYSAAWAAQPFNFDLLGVDLYPEGQAGGGQDPYGTNRVCRLSMTADEVVRPYALLTGAGQGQWDNASPADSLSGTARLDGLDAHPKYPNINEWEAIRLISAHAQLLGKPWGSGETGLISGATGTAIARGGTRDTQFRYTNAQRAQRIADMVADFQTIELPPLIICAYDDGSCNFTDAPDMNSVTVWRQAYSIGAAMPDNIAL
jgi:hypothetical protein